MNKIFKVIYSKTRHCYVVVSELAKSHCKTTQSHTVRSKTALTAAVLLALGAFSFVGMPPVQATESLFSNDYVGTNYKKDDGSSYSAKETKNYHGAGTVGVGSNTLGMNAIAGKNTITIGDRDASAATESVYIGAKYDANNQVHPSSGKSVVSVGYGSDAAGTGSIAIGSGASADTFDNAGSGTNPDKASQSIAIGNNAQAKQNNIAIGAGSVAIATASTADAYLTGQAAVSSYVSVGGGTVTTTDPKTKKMTTTTTLRRLTNVADGAADSDVATVGQLKKLSDKAGVYNEGWGIKIGDYTKKDANGQETTVKNAISIDRNLGSNEITSKSNNTFKAAGENSLILGGAGTDDFVASNGKHREKDYGSYGKDSVLVGGENNKTTKDGTYAVISGGGQNIASGEHSFIGGGWWNTATGATSTVVGGQANTASGNQSTVVGGQDSRAIGDESTILGGFQHTAVGENSTISGGAGAYTLGQYSSVSGGQGNVAIGMTSSADGGWLNFAYGDWSQASGGYSNYVLGNASNSLGGRDSVIQGNLSVGIAGGSTGQGAGYALAAGYQSVVTAEGVHREKSYDSIVDSYLEAGNDTGGNEGYKYTDVATALGYQATADAPNTVSFGHDKGDVSGYTVNWDFEYETDAQGNFKLDENGMPLVKAVKPNSISMNYYDTAKYNRLVKAADGIEDHDAVVMEQLKNASDVGSKIKVYQTDENGNIKFDKNNNPIEDTSDSDAVKTKREAAQKASEDAWGKAIGTGKIADPTKSDTNDPEANGSQQLVTGGTVYDALQKQKTELTDSLSVNAGWGIDIDKAKKNTISVKHNLGTGYADTDATGLILGGSLQNRDAAKEYGTATASSVIVGAQNALASNDNSVVVGGLDNVASGANSTVVGGDNNKASGNQSAVFGGRDNTASGIASTAGGGIMNVANGWQSTAIGGFSNYALGTGSTSVGGYGKDYATGHNSSVNGNYSVGIAGGSTGKDANYSLAAGRQAVVTTENGTAIGYQATTDEANTIAFGHDAGDVSGYTIEWEQLPNGQVNADGTSNDYTKAPTVTENKYESAAYNRLVKAADGVEDHDAVVMEQLKNASNVGQNIKVYKTDENGNVQFDESNNPIEDTSDSDDVKTRREAAQKASEDAWGKAIGTGKIADPTKSDTNDPEANGSQQLVTGGTVYTEVRPATDGTYVKTKNTTAANLTALDKQVAANTTKLGDKNHNIKYYSVEDKISDDKLLPSISGYSNEKNDGAKGAGSMAAGFNTHADGIASTVAGSYSGVVGTGLQGAAALSYGTFNVNQNAAQAGTFSGVANSIVGQANVTTDSNAAIIYGAGNTVKNSYRDIDTKNASEIKAAAGSGDVTKLGEALQKAVPTSGGQVMVMGGGNNVESAYMSQVVGVGNTVKGNQVENTKGEWGTDTSDTAIKDYNSEKSSQYNYVDGFNNEVINGKHDYIIGSNNTVSGDSTDNNQSNIVFGDNHKLTSQKNNVIIGSSDTTDDETKVSDVVAIGHNAKVSAEGGVAIGSGSEATVTGKSTEGYDPATGQNSTKTTAAWQATNAAVSIGTSDGTVTRQINGVAAGTNDTDAVNVAQLKKLEGMKANVDASNIGANLKGSDGKTAASASDITANEDAWGTAIGTGTIASNSGQLVTGKTVYGEVRPTADGTYIKTANTTAANLTALDTQVGTNTGDITNLKDLSNISNKGETVIKNLAKNTVKVKAGERVTVTDKTDSTTGAITYTVSANNNGAVAAGDTNLVSGDTVNTAITNAVNNAGTETDTKLAGKANVDASNIGANLKGSDGKTAASASDITANEDAWGTAIGTGTIASTSGQLVTGKTVYGEVRPTADGTYIKTANTTAANLTALDTQVGTNTGDITNLKDLSNISNKGETVIKNLAKNTVKVKAGERVTVTDKTDSTTGAITYTVSANNNGAVAAGDTNLVSGDTVNTAITNAVNNAGTETDTKLAGKANVDASNIGANLKGSDGKTAASASDITANEDAWGTAIGTGTIASTSGQLVTGKTVYSEVRPTADGTYIKTANTTAANLTALDTQVGRNTTNISNLQNGEGFTDKGNTYIKNLAKGSIGMENGSHTTVSHRDANGVETYKVDVNVDGKVESGNKGIVDGGAVYSAIQDVKNQTSADLANKANVDASNLTPNNVTKWQEKLGNGKVESGNTGLVTGDTVFKAVDTKANRDGSNLTDKEADSFSEKIARGEVKAGENRAVSGDAVSQAISKVTGDMNTKLDGKANTSLDNITKDGQTVIKKLSQDAVQVKAGDDHITVDAKTDETTGNKTYTISAKDGKVASGDTGLISGGTLYNEVHVDKDGSYIKSGNTVGNNLSALDTGLKNTSSLIHTNTSGDTIHIGETSKATKVDVSSTDANGNKNGRVVTGVVTDAKDANSAANVGYVNGLTAANTQQIYRDMNNAYSRLDTNINRAAAGSNALAALHPLDFDPADKASFAVGYGHYRNANAAAVGAFYQPNANTMVNMGISLGNGDPGFNAGVSFKIGKGSAYNGVSKAEMAQTIHDQATEISAIKADDAAKDKRIDALEKENQEMKKQIQEILARLNG